MMRAVLIWCGLMSVTITLTSCGDPTPPPQTAEINPATQQSQLAAMHDEIERDHALALQYHLLQEQKHANDVAAQRKEYLEDRERTQSERERLLRILTSAQRDAPTHAGEGKGFVSPRRLYMVAPEMTRPGTSGENATSDAVIPHETNSLPPHAST